MESIKKSYVATKFSPPKYYKNTITRWDLLERLREEINAPLTIIKAPSGFGKTTLAVQWRKELVLAGKRVGWVALEESENNVTQFLECFVKTLQDAGLNNIFDTISLYRPSDYRSLKSVATAMINDINKFGQDIFLFFDDFDSIKNKKVLYLLGNIFRHAPNNFHMILIARTSYNYRFDREVFGHKRVVRIGLEDLRFDVEKTQLLLEEIVGNKLPAAEVQRIFELTEGWVAAIQWVSLAMRVKARPHRLALLSIGDLKADMEHLVNDSLARLTRRERRFLLMTSILERFDAEICKYLTGFQDSDEIILRLTRCNPFIQPIEENGIDIGYKHHHLFREMLYRKLVKQYLSGIDDIKEKLHNLSLKEDISPFSAELQKLAVIDRGRLDLFALHRKAARWFRNRGMMIEAVTHAMAGGDLPLALSHIESSAPLLLDLGRLNTIMSWAERLPKNAEKCRPRLVYALGWAYTLTCQLETAREKLSTLEEHDLSDGSITPFEIEALRAAIWAYDDRADKALDIENHWPPEGSPFSVAAGTNVLVFALAMTGAYGRARHYVNWIEQQDKLRTVFFPTIYRKTLLGYTYAREGNLKEACLHLREAVALSDPIHGRRSAAACVPAGILAEILYERNELREVEALLAGRLDVLNETIFPEGLIRAYVAGARTFFATGDTDRALALLEQLYVYGKKRGYNRAIVYALFERVSFLLLRNRLTDALKLLEEMRLVESKEQAREGGNLVEIQRINRMALIKYDMFVGDYLAGIKKARELISQFKKCEAARPRMMVRLHILLANGHDGQGDRERCEAHLLQALEIGRTSGFVRTFLDEGKWMYRKIRQLNREKPLSDELSGYSYFLLSNFEVEREKVEIRLEGKPISGARHPTAVKRAGDRASLLTNREVEILRLVGRGLPNKRIAAALNISDETVKWYFKRIYSKLGVSGRVYALDRARELGIIR